MPIGQHLVGGQPRLNPFAPPPQLTEQGTPATPIMPQPPAGAATPPIAPPPEQQRERFAGWKAFFQQVKSDPNTRLALAQFFIGLTQPNDSPQAAIGSALDRGVQTLQALRTQDYERSREAAGDQRDERRVEVSERQAGVAEAGVDVDKQRLEQQSSQFDSSLSQDALQHKDKLELERQKLEKDEAYQKELLRLRQEELNIQRSQATGENAGGVQGSLWTRLREGLLADPPPELAAITDPEARRRRAELMAFDFQKNAGQTREKVVADFISSQLLFIEHLRGKPEEYSTALQRVVEQAKTIADSADLRSRAVTPTPGTPPTTGAPAAPASGAPPQAAAPAPATPMVTGGVFPPGSTTPQAAPPAPSAPLPVGSMTEQQLQQELEELIRRGQPQQ